MSSAKEREILERQRLLAARLKPPAAPGPPTAGIGGRNQAKKEPIRAATSSTFRAAAPAGSTKPTNGSTARKGSKTSETKNEVIDLTVQKRPSSFKRPTSAKSSSAILAAARAKAGDAPINAATMAVKRKPPPPTHPRQNGENISSPKLQRKVLPNAQTSSLLAATSSLASLVKHVAHGNGMTHDDSMAQSLQTHKPDDFWKNIRDWDLPSQLFREMRLQQQQRDDTNDNALVVKQTRKPIPDTFLNAKHYVAAWAPLCMDECRSQLLQEVTQSMTAPILVKVEATDSRIRYRHNRDHGAGDDAPWMEENETGGYVMINTAARGGGGGGGSGGTGSDKMRFFPNDIVLLVQKDYRDLVQDVARGTAVPPMGADLDSISVFAGKSLIGHTESSRSELNGLIVKVSKRKWAVVGKKEMYLIKVGSNVTALREFTALCNVDTLPMKTFLLGQHLERAENRRKLSRNQPVDQLLQQMGGDQLGEGFLEYAKKKFNPSQLTAIAASAHEYGEGGFTLIKGPPGTGSKLDLVFRVANVSSVPLNASRLSIVNILVNLALQQKQRRS
jgi:hypothetical protein